jgi:FlaG/FlaF family flagellin (archaellin)
MTGMCKRRLLLRLAVAVTVMLAGILAVSQFGSFASAQAESPPGSERCSLATLNGVYVWSAHGEVQSTGSTEDSFAVAGIQVFDGRGHAHGFYSRSMSEQISSRVSFTATYTLNPDCTGTHVATDITGTVVHNDMYSLPSGSKVTFLQTDPGAVFSGTGVTDARKID